MRILFMATGEIAVPVVRALCMQPGVIPAGLVTQPDKPVGRRQILTAPPVKTALAGTGIPILQPARVRDAVAELGELNPDLILVMAYGQILPRQILELPPLGCVNLHASLLPRHRGAAPIQAAILAGDHTSGITVMFMDEGLDTGDLILARMLPLRRRETGGTLHDRLAALAVPAMVEALPLLAAGEAPRTPQAQASTTYAPKLDRHAGAIDWRRSCAELDRHVRAMNPWPGAFTTLPDGTKLKVFRALPCHRCNSAPGVVARTTPRGILVGCGSGGLLLREVQGEGRTRMSAGEFVRGHPLRDGTQLNPVEPS